MNGYVYILSNPSMPGLVKIGMTTRSVEGRANELYQTGVPTPFIVEHWVLSPDCAQLERDVHGLMPDLRVGDGREFFRCDPSRARDLLDEAHAEQLRSFVSEFTETFVLCEEPFAIDPGDAHMVASRTRDVHPFEIAAALHLLDPEALQEAVDRDRARMKAALERRAEERSAAMVVVSIQ